MRAAKRSAGGREADMVISVLDNESGDFDGLILFGCALNCFRLFAVQENGKERVGELGVIQRATRMKVYVENRGAPLVRIGER